jgi:uncharacterized protein YbgA (DUF1722 family)/uncharacterized protein YbbK (DUF523 family)
VRFDGGHKRDTFLLDSFGRHVEWLPVCPEVELGLGTPRETLRLQRGREGLSLVAPKSGLDHTAAMRAYARQKVAELAALGPHGFVLKKDSPSCGLQRVRVYPLEGLPDRSGRGLFAEALLERLPHLPVEEEGRLGDARLRDNFVERVFAYWSLQALFEQGPTPGALVAFHTAHKLLLLAHAPRAYSELGRLVAGAAGLPRAELRARYEAGFMDGLATLASPRKHANVLQHMLGHLRPALAATDRDELLATIEDHRLGLVPLIVPVTLLRHHARRLGNTYLLGQVYLDPHPKELMLRNHV